MKEHPILMSSPMVRAILDGCKTQTRRVIKPFPFVGKSDGNKKRVYCDRPHDLKDLPAACPYGKISDRLWVRETFSASTDGKRVCYRATLPPLEFAMIEKWKPSIVMPRWASRSTLEITGIQVQRVQEISEDDARAEGCESDAFVSSTDTYRVAYAALWDSINGKPGYSWASNPFIWAISFKVVCGGPKGGH